MQCCNKSNSSKQEMISFSKFLVINTVVVFFGVLFFSFSFHKQCSLVLQGMELRHNHSVSEAETLFDEAKKAHLKCLNDKEKDSVRVSDLSGRLEPLTALASKYNLLLEEHMKAIKIIEELELGLQQKVEDLEEEIQKTKEQAEEIKGLHYELKSQIDLNQRQSESIEILRENVDATEELKHAHHATIQHIQQRHSALCRKKFGLGPYYVLFSVLLEENAMKSFVIEIASRVQLPHSTYTFLSLVESKLFNDFIISSDPHHLYLEMGSEQESVTRSKALGFRDAALSFLETSTMFRCEKYAVGFTSSGYGPGLKIFMSDESTDDDKNVCFGKIVRGKQTLALLDRDLQKRSRLKLFEARYLEF